ncbi:DegV family protein [Alkaliphilus hydrothermalis]|uniref:DegV family protein with EDD domain n=1 Tax=Alkaliphilus hydrothermalis TaxID=1482730 RepID=A0ABS2NQY4_9FIRM|nr:DegV family protein [Alkaliphilus hydrothermalis]MBM7615246.1 DegV family protein with EDD domain [Alkaliphilus hydrothermalis]
MSNIQIVTDSTAYIDKAFAEANNIAIVPLSVNFQGVISDEPCPGEFKEFFNRLVESSDFPTTSQPPVGMFASVYEKALAEGKEVIAITLSSKLSGTYNSAYTAATLVDADQISVIDSLAAAANIRVLVEMALQLVEEGFSRQEIVEKIQNQKHRMGIALTVGTLEYLKRGGRLSNFGAIIGSLLNIKPIIALKDGKLEAIDKVRGRRKSLERLIADVHGDSNIINICHIFCLEEAQELKALLEERFPNAKVGIEELGPVIGAHLGPMALGVAYKY